MPNVSNDCLRRPPKPPYCHFSSTFSPSWNDHLDPSSKKYRPPRTAYIVANKTSWKQKIRNLSKFPVATKFLGFNILTTEKIHYKEIRNTATIFNKKQWSKFHIINVKSSKICCTIAKRLLPQKTTLHQKKDGEYFKRHYHSKVTITTTTNEVGIL